MPQGEEGAKPGCQPSSLLWIKALEGLGRSQAVYKLHNERIRCTRDDHLSFFYTTHWRNVNPVHDQNE